MKMQGDKTKTLKVFEKVAEELLEEAQHIDATEFMCALAQVGTVVKLMCEVEGGDPKEIRRSIHEIRIKMIDVFIERLIKLREDVKEE